MRAFKKLFGFDSILPKEIKSNEFKATHTIASDPEGEDPRIINTYEMGEASVTEARMAHRSERVEVEVKVPDGIFRCFYIDRFSSLITFKSSPFDPSPSRSLFMDGGCSFGDSSRIEDWVKKEGLIKNPEIYPKLFPILCTSQRHDIRSHFTGIDDVPLSKDFKESHSISGEPEERSPGVISTYETGKMSVTAKRKAHYATRISVDYQVPDGVFQRHYYSDASIIDFKPIPFDPNKKETIIAEGDGQQKCAAIKDWVNKKGLIKNPDRYPTLFPILCSKQDAYIGPYSSVYKAT